MRGPADNGRFGVFIGQIPHFSRGSLIKVKAN